MTNDGQAIDREMTSDYINDDNTSLNYGASSPDQ